MAQQTLTFTLDKKKYVSKPFNFEAFCQINENHIGDVHNSIYTCTKDTVYYLFEGTDATNDIIEKVSVPVMAKMCQQLWAWYGDTFEATQKND